MEASIEAIHARCDEVGDCWEWRGPTNDGVPIMRIDGSRRLLQVRRVVLQLQGKNIDGLLAIAKCRTRLCVKPAHAAPVTRAALQKLTAQETRYGQRLSRRAALAAARRKTAVLTEETVAEMRASGLTTHQAARAFGCSQSAAADAMVGRSWRDYTSPFAALEGAR